MTKILTPIVILLLFTINIACNNPKKHSVEQTQKKDTISSTGVTHKAEPDLRQLIRMLRSALKSYSHISPYKEYAVRSLDIPAAITGSILAKKTPQGQVMGDEIIEDYQNEIDRLITAILDHKDIQQHFLPDILKSEYLQIAASDDRKLFSLSISQNTGGTYQSQMTWIHYRFAGGKNINFRPAFYLKDNEAPLPFKSDGYDRIYAVPGEDGPLYLMQGQVASCSTCIDQYIDLISLKKGIPKPVFSFAYAIRRADVDDADEGIFYDPRSRSIQAKYNTSDLTPECYCTNATQLAEEKGKTEQADLNEEVPLRECRCLFKFNGKTFLVQD